MNPKRTTGYWVPVASPLGHRDRHKFLSNAELKESLEQIEAHHVYIISDACFAGTLITRSGGEEKLFENKSSRRVLTSGHIEEVQDGPPGGHSPFAEALLSCLRNSSATLLSMELEAQVVRDYLKTLKRLGHKTGLSQRPSAAIITGLADDGGQFVFHPKRDEARDWAAAQATDSFDNWLDYVRRYRLSDQEPELSRVLEALDHIETLIEGRRADPKILRQLREQIGTLQAGQAKLKRSTRKANEERIAGESQIEALQSTLDQARETQQQAEEQVLLLSQQAKGLTDELEQARQKDSDAYQRAAGQAWEDYFAQIASAAELDRYLRWFPMGPFAEKAREKQEMLARLSVPEMVRIPAGTFRMGGTTDRDKPIHPVSLDSFDIGKYPVTNLAFCAFLNAVPLERQDLEEWISLKEVEGKEKCRITLHSGIFYAEESYEQHPVTFVSWFGAAAYCNWLREETGEVWRLPTEAEWEFAAGGGSLFVRTEWAGTAKEESLGDYAWYKRSSAGKTHPVGQKKPNELGLYDMSGNVWEWCADYYGEYSSEAQTNPTGPSEGSHRVLRGGGWFNYAVSCRVADRLSVDPSNRNGHLGFRLARSF